MGNIVLIDSDLRYQETLSAVLGSNHSLQIISAAKQYSQSMGRSHVDVILINETLPDMSAHELCELIKEHPQMAAVSVIFVTDDPQPCKRTRAYLCGSDDYLDKSCSAADLLMVIDIALSERISLAEDLFSPLSQWQDHLIGA